LFGNADFCECNECNSVYGAAAYLTDILHFLDERNTTQTGIAVKDILLYRRPDIGDIDLDCENTNTEIPYIDIACELMEDYIQPPVVTLSGSFLSKLNAGTIDPSLLTAIINQFTTAGFQNLSGLLTDNAQVSEKYSSSRYNGSTEVTEDHWMIRDALIALKATNTGAGVTILLLHQTLLSADEISANPEYINVPTYSKLAATQRPFTLPFDLFETEGELYLQKLGVAKADLIAAFIKEHDASGPPTDSDLNMAYAYLNVNNAERTLIFQEDLVNQANYWGALAAGTSVKVDDFEQATGLVYSDILSLLGLTFINPLKDSVIEHDDLSCDTDKQHIINITPGKFDRMHRFIRLWKKTGMQMPELDAVILSDAIGKGKLDPYFAVELHHFSQLQNSWSLDTFQLLSFYQDLDTNGSSSLYNGLFQNRSVTNPVNVDFAPPQVIVGTMAITSVHMSVIAAAIGLLPADLGALVAKTDGKLSLSNLSFFYRSYLLSQALSISIGDEMDLLDIINISPFNDPATTSVFTQRFKTLTISGFSISEVNYILRHQDDQYNSFIPNEKQVAAAISPLQNSLLQVRSTTTVSSDPQGILLTKWLTDPLLNWNASLVTKLMDILNTSDDTEYKQKIDNNHNFLLNLRVNYYTSLFTADLGTMPAVIFPDDLASQISYDNDYKQLRLIGYISTTDKINLLGLSADPAYQKAVNNLYDSAQQTDNSAAHIFFSSVAAITTLRSIDWTNVADRFAYFLNIISPVYEQLQQQNAIVAQIINWFKTDKSVASQLLNSVGSFYTDLTKDDFVNKSGDLTTANYPNQFNDYLRLQKICFIVNKLKLSADDLEWQLANVANVQGLDYMNLPLAAVAGPVTTFGSFETLISILKFEQHYPEITTDDTVIPPVTLSVYDIFNDAINNKPVAGIEADMVALTGWNASDLKKLAEAPNYLNLLSPADFKSASILLRLHQCFKILTQLNITADDAITWCNAALTYEDVVKIKQTLKLKYSEADWLTVTQPLQDGLREKKRDALIAYLLANPGTQAWSNDTDLYGYLLLDVEMGACQPTSRIVQATNSVQLFVQRCLLQLEKNIVIDSSVDNDWTQWEWMKYFRLWQANYKVFLYPENWIEPELLPVKSTFFSDLENDLQQNEATKENVEDAFMNYLEKLDGVSRLEVKNMWYDDPSGNLYVFARTYGGDPKTYYFRQLVEDRRWTPWEKIDLDIKSDHIVPVVYNNRIYLFWAVFNEKSDDPSDSDLTIPTLGGSGNYPPPARPRKYWQIQIAYSEYKNRKWSPQKVSNNDATGFITAYEDSYPDKPAFLFAALDIPDIDITTLVSKYSSNKDSSTLINTLLDSLTQNGNLVINCYYQHQYENTGYEENNSSNNFYYDYLGSFELDPCHGYPTVVHDYVQIKPILFDRSSLANMLDDEATEYPNNALSLQSGAILNQTPGTFNNVVPLQMGFLDRLVLILLLMQYAAKGQYGERDQRRLRATLGTFMPFFYQDADKAYYVRPELTDDEAFEFLYADFEKLLIALLEQNTAVVQEILATIPKNHKFSFRYHFFNFYHPLVCYFMRQLFTKGLDGLMSRDTQLKGDIAYDPSNTKFSFKDYYDPTALVYDESPDPVTYPNGVIDPDPGYPKADVDFDQKSGYALYNWELFFHAPLMIAERLDQNQQFEGAEKWYRYIFNPSDTSAYPSPDKFWVTKPFFINVDNKYFTQRIANILLGVDSGEQDLVQDVSDWRNNPFQPHYIAEYRTVAYQKTAVMKYLDHLMAWGDYLFTQDTMESVNQATQLYVLASQILGPKPQIIAPAYDLPVENYYQLQFKLDSLSNAMVEIENLVPLQTITGYDGTTPQNGLPQLQTLYFCLRVNDQLLGYWDTIANRLYNIRHCLNIEGVFAPPALFAPAIDPGLLVRAAAAGLDIGSILNDLNSPLPYYRFGVIIQKATELTNEIKSLGASLLSALEKKDAEALALLRSDQEISVLKAVMAVKNKQVDEAQASLDNLSKQQELITIRRNYYQVLISTGLNTGEITALALNAASTAIDAAIAIGYALSGGLKLIPDFMIGAAGFGGSPTATAQTGGNSFGNSAEDAVKTLSSIATGLDKGASLASTVAGYTRRTDEWKFQLTLANKELEQIDKQILAAQIRLDIANKDVKNQQLQIDNAKAADDFMHSKFTNEDLYNWMITQISTVYFQAYNLAYTTAKKAEQCFRYELGLSDSTYISFGYWNSLKKGLLSGEQLMYDLKKMEMAYFEQNKREYELTKHISLAQLDGIALLKFKTTGECWVNLPEELFDMDYPGHYMRRVKSVSLTIPCIAGPYTTVSCMLTLNKNTVRSNPDASGSYPRKTSNGIPADDPRFRDTVAAVQSITTSSAQNDSGLFDLNFRDERYLPFEGAGAISLWH
ncbi:MAG TPA: neuraminidase-like domain-containing protein, partial [Chitinophagaceae bacterium]|nr:neuraminidase-like domain-containing protein [Chitinophagaceae bacterium]